mmetsp:Transcript_36501/g.88020  ORF Transcript_36501/g.88020 Transcript_36501/m.88020 type:complete len:185 (+) Transcript_36501:148-702(+)
MFWKVFGVFSVQKALHQFVNSEESPKSVGLTQMKIRHVGFIPTPSRDARYFFASFGYYHLEVRELPLEWNHRITAVWNSNTLQGGYGSRNLVRAQECEDGKLGKTSIVEFGSQTALLCFFRHFLVETKGVIKVKNKVDIVPEQCERGVFSRLTSLGVVRESSAASTLVPQLQHGNDSEDLPLGS